MTHSRRPVALHPESPTLRARLKARITVTESGCWEWTGSRSVHGYGWVRNGDKTVKAHRASFAAFVRPLIAGETVCHRCDNPPCINPDHLFAGTMLDNTRDMIAKGRRREDRAYIKGESHHQAKLTETDVRRLRQMRAEGATYAQLMAEFGLAKSTVGDICTGRHWSHIT